MAGLSEGEEDQFFDTHDEITSVSDLVSDCSDECCSNSRFPNSGVSSLRYEVWTKAPESAYQRRCEFLKWMGGLSLDQNQVEDEESGEILRDEIGTVDDRITRDSFDVLRNSNSGETLSSTRSSVSCFSTEEAELLGEDVSDEVFACKIKNLDDGTEFAVDEVSNNGMLSRLREVGSDRLVNMEEFQRTYGSSSLVQRLLRREAEACNLVDMKNKQKSGWIRKLRKANWKSSGFNSELGARFRRVRVHSYKKRSMELSSLYAGQDFPAHEGSISTMKFSPDGQYLASGGKDGIVRVWKVVEDEKPNVLDILHTDPSCLYFSVDHLSKLTPLDVNKDKIGKMQRLRKSSESALVIFPPKIFRIMEEPLHEFHGHSGEVLALSWSKNGCLLSSSVDKTVRLWQVGDNQCLRVFSHNNYVTCVEFNPVDDNYFVSGSIDGKVLIWEVRGRRVLDWVDIKEIVTAVSYYPSGKRVLVGSMEGSCRFYDIRDNLLQLDAEICLQGKKKVPCKRITGFQFSPSDPTKVLVTSADAQVRILCEADVIVKFKSPGISGSQVTASFTADGRHVVSAGEDSNVYVWDSISEGRTSPRAKKVYSCERFLSQNTSIAIPWCGMEAISGSQSTPCTGDDLEDFINSMPLSSRDCFSMTRGLFLESLPKGSATWPEEKLPNSREMMAVSPTMRRSEHKLLRSAYQNMVSSHSWGLVIVTAGLDGRIRTYHNYGLPIRL
ncbi:uncharacterized protein LOC130793001 [Actinidia eriantha]|uniref:uncharacterized protein LOC130793001 n=1 Tax=Actinidia eriantha TaxID=165200 RepID=UPI002588E99C|nr:uncharacterized protein LOC130793001 [Actinidia eriantha]